MSTLGRRALLHGGVATAALFAVSRPVQAQVQDAARAGMARAAAALIAALEPSQRQAVVFPFGHDERMNWHYVPRSRAGLAFKDMRPAGRTAAHELMKASLSGVGHAKAVNVVRLEEVLRQLETFGGLSRDPEKYYVSVFGAPAAATPWGWRLEGHHLSTRRGAWTRRASSRLVEFEAKWPLRGSGPAGRGAARNEETIWPS